MTGGIFRGEYYPGLYPGRPQNWIFTFPSGIMDSFSGAGANANRRTIATRERERSIVGDTNTTLILGGFLLTLICQDIVAIKAIRKNTREGILCAMIPGYILYYVNREGASQYAKPLIGWLAGVGLILAGLMR